MKENKILKGTDTTLKKKDGTYTVFFCDPGATRTPNQQNRNLSFYPLNYGTNSFRKSITKSPVLQLNHKISLTRLPNVIPCYHNLIKIFYFCTPNNGRLQASAQTQNTIDE